MKRKYHLTLWQKNVYKIDYFISQCISKKSIIFSSVLIKFIYLIKIFFFVIFYSIIPWKCYGIYLFISKYSEDYVFEELNRIFFVYLLSQGLSFCCFSDILVDLIYCSNNFTSTWFAVRFFRRYSIILLVRSCTGYMFVSVSELYQAYVKI